MTPIVARIPAYPESPDPALQEPDEFSLVAAAFVLAMKDNREYYNDMADQINVVAEEINEAVEIAEGAIAAAETVTAVTGTTKWISGTTYAEGVTTWSPINFQTYRRKIAGAGTTDPSLDITNWALIRVGGSLDFATATGSYAFPATPTFVTVTPTRHGTTTTLPNATLMGAGAGVLGIRNASRYWIRVCNYTGVLLGFVPPNTTVNFGLSDNSTSAGVWTHTLVREGIGGELASPGQMSFSVVAAQASIVMDGDIEIVYGYRPSDGYVVAQAFKKSTGESGTLTVIRAGAVSSSSRFAAIKNSSTQLLVVSCTSTTALEAVIVTLNPSTLALTPNTAATQTLAGNLTGFATGCAIVALPSLPNSYVITYERTAGPVGAIRAISVSGTTPTIGAETLLDGSSVNPIVVATADKVIVASTATTHLYTKPYTISGSSISAGTGTDTNSSTMTANKLFALGSRWCVLYNDGGSTVKAGIISLSGTTTTISTVTAIASTTLQDAIVVNGKVLVLSTSASPEANLITDTAGTASAGTGINLNNASAKKALWASGTKAGVAEVSSNSITYSILDCSGASAVVSKMTTAILDDRTVGSSNASTPVLDKSAAGYYGSDFHRTTASASAQANKAEYSETGVELFPIKFVVSANGTGGRGGTDLERWLTTGSTNGGSVYKLECAA